MPVSAVRFVRGDVQPVHQEMAIAAGDKHLWVVSGGDLAGQFYDAGLLDELELHYQVLPPAPIQLAHR